MYRLIACFTAVFLISSCSFLPDRARDKSSGAGSSDRQMISHSGLNDDLIVQNLIYALAQLPEMHPYTADLQMKQPVSSLSSLIDRRLKDAGYRVQYFESDNGVGKVHFEYQNTFSAHEKRTTYKIAVGSTAVERDYAMEGRQTVPQSVMRITAPSKQNIILNDDIFGEQKFTNAHYANVVFKESERTDFVEIKANSTAQSDISIPSTKSSPAAPAFKDNVRNIMKSNYADVFTEYEDVKQEILMFPNDSLRMGEHNKSTIQNYIKDFNPETDIISVVGCSNGPTAINDGNQVLAIGRANRIKEALIFSGLDQGVVLEEGCWGETGFDEYLPRRGVVVTHKRRAGAE